MKAAVLLAVLVSVYGLHAQTTPQFDVASIKSRGTSCRSSGAGAMPVPGHLRMECMPLTNLIQMAYVYFADGVTLNREPADLTGLPGWAESEHFDVDAKTEGPVPVAQMGGPMLQALLEERFKLKLHRETKEVSAYALTVGKNGPKMKPSEPGSCIPIDLDHLPQPKPGEKPPNFCGNMRMQGGPKSMILEATGTSMADFARNLRQQADRPVVDRTGLPGLYDFHIEIPRDDTTGFGPDVILGAIQERLGLKLVAEKSTSNRLIVDSIEKLAEN